MDRTDGMLDAAVLVYREDPTPENRATLLAAQEAHAAAFVREQTGTFIERTR